MTALDSNVSYHPSAGTMSRRQIGLLGSLAGVILTLKPNSRGSPEVPNWLRRDVGLPPVAESWSYWDFR